MMHELITYHPWFLYVAVALLSLAIGSLLNVVIYRLPLMLKNEWLHEYNELMSIEDEERTTLNLFLPRSFCPSCNTMIKAWQNIPILSFLILRGRCYYCKTSISPRYPLIEVGTMLLSLFACWHFDFTWQLVFALSAIWLLICLFLLT